MAHNTEFSLIFDAASAYAAQQPATSRSAKGAKQPPANDGTNHTDDKITNKPEATALDKFPGQPACWQYPR